MEVYLASKEDWYTFVVGDKVTAHTEYSPNHYKKILVSPIEIVSEVGNGLIEIIKKY